MRIEDIAPLQMARTDPRHTGTAPLNNTGSLPLNNIPNPTRNSSPEKTFGQYLTDAISSMNSDQTNVTKLQQQVITDPDSVDIHDVTIAISKAKMSLNLAQSVIDRMIQGWNEVTTTR